MLDLKLLRTQADDVTVALKKRGYDFDWDLFHDLDAKRKTLQSKTQQLQAERNKKAKLIGRAKAQGEDIQPLLDQVADAGDELAACELQQKIALQELNNFLMQVPNLPHDTIPEGADETANVEIKRCGDPKTFDFPVQSHVDLAQKFGVGIDAPAGVSLAGSRFTVLRGVIARLHRALAQFMLDQHTTLHGYVEYYVPYMVNQACLEGTGQLPKFGEDLFHIAGDSGLSLIPTAEVSLTNLVREKIVNKDQLPLKMTAHTPSFRREAGSYGRDMQGLMRQHQFDKVEMVQVVTADNAERALQEMLGHAEAILQALELPYRVVELCSGDLGFHAQKTYDLEVWVPTKSGYSEISSCSRCGDYQARRMQARYYEADGSTAYVHTLNGSGLAVGRTLLAFLENHQCADGSISVPVALQPYLGVKSIQVDSK